MMWNCNNSFRYVLSLFALLVVSGPALAEEKILSFDSEIQVNKDASMTVTETIKVRAERKKIKRGIYRDFPTYYTTKSGRRLRVDVRSVRRNGDPEPHFTRSIRRGKRLFIGEQNVYLDKGVHTYEITYATNRTIEFFEQHDELYWNVTGNNWAFPIEQASVTLTLPEPVEKNRMQIHGYTGYEGSTGDDYRIVEKSERKVSLETTKKLQPKQGFTILVGWPKGVVEKPSRMEKLHYFITDIGYETVALLVVFFLIWVSIFLLVITGGWMLFQKAEQPGWGFIIPIYNLYLMVDIAERPGWWLILYFVPLVNVVVGFVVWKDIAKRFGKDIGFAIGLLLIPFIFIPILGFGSSEYGAQ